MSSRARLPWLWLPALLALGWHWPVLAHGFRSDDFLTVYYLDRDAGTVQWGRVFEEWVRPWFGVRDLYRPLVSLTLGLNWACGTAPFGFHLLNVLLLAGTATAVAAAAARLCPSRPALAGLAGAGIVVLHPAAVEPAAWIAARTTGLQVFWSAVAYWGFLRWRDGAGGRWLPLVATALACASKEGAVLLPVSFVALDLLRGARPAWRTHLPFAGLVGAYLLFRRGLLGVVTTAEEGHTMGERVGGALALLRQLAMPPAGGTAGSVWLLVALAACAAGALGGARRALWCLPWAGCLLLPGTTHVQIAAHDLAGRFVFDAVPALALFVAVLVVARRPWLVGLGALAFGTGLATASRVHLGDFAAQDRLIARVQQELLTKAADAGPGRPFGVVGLPKLPLLQPALWGFLTQRPFAPSDLPVVGLDAMLTRDPNSPRAFADTTAVHALVGNGAGFGRWDPASESIVLLPKAPPEVVEFVRDPRAPGRFVPPRLLPPTAVAALEVTSPVPVSRWRATVLGNLLGDFACPPFAREGVPVQSWWLDTTRLLPWAVAAAVGGGPSGIEVTLDGRAPEARVAVRAHAALPGAALPGDAGQSIDRSRLAERMRWPGRAPGSAATAYLLLPTGLFAVPVPEGGTLVLDETTLGQIRFACDVLGPCRAHWFWQSGSAEGPPRRTLFGTCIVR